MLIRDGAILVRNGADVIELLGTSNLPAPRRVIPAARPPAPARPAPPQPALPRSLRDTAALHRQILDRLSPSPMAEDQLIRDLQTSAHVVAPVLIDLELDGRIRRQSGGLLSRIN